QPSDEQLQQEEPQIENQDIIPSQEPEEARVPEVQGEKKGPVLEADQQELTMEDTRDQCGDGPEVMEHILSNLEPIIVPEAGMPLPSANQSDYMQINPTKMAACSHGAGPSAPHPGWPNLHGVKVPTGGGGLDQP
uniref:GAGE domain-containing protein n=1 Tax=Myotis lucifugus TaxID=59463 RepID=G1P7U0_MYOLU